MGTVQKILTTTLWGLLVLIMLSVVGAGLWRENRDRQAAQAMLPADGDAAAAAGGTGDAGPLMFEVPPFTLVDQNGSRVTRESLRGRPWVAAFIFTNCTQACPMMSMKLAKLQDALPGRDVKIVSFTLDPERDTPEVLRAYADRYGADAERWHLLTGDKQAIYDVAAGMKLSVVPATETSEIVHSDRFALVDADGKVRRTYLSSDDAALAELADDVQFLLPAETGPLAPAPAAGVPTH